MKRSVQTVRRERKRWTKWPSLYEERKGLIEDCAPVTSVVNGPAWFENGIHRAGIQKVFTLTKRIDGHLRRRYGVLQSCANCHRQFISFEKKRPARFCTHRCSKLGERNPMRHGKKKLAKQTADKWFSLLVRASGACLKCGTSELLQCAHIFSRRYLATRWDERNAVCLCRGCHMYFTHRPLEWEEWISDKIGRGVYSEVRAAAIRGPKPDLEALLDIMVPKIDKLRGAAPGREAIAEKLALEKARKELS